MADVKPPAKPPVKKAPAPSSFGFPKIAELIIAIILIIIILPFVTEYFFPSSTGAVMPTFVTNVLSFIKMISTIVSMLALVVIVYAFIQIREVAEAEKKKLGLMINWKSERKQKNVRWERVETYIQSANPSDWKIAILEADNILDEIVERMGYQGSTLGERMKKIEASDFPYLDETWQVHKLRNSIAHKGTDYPLTRSEADDAISTYKRVFKELGYLS